MPTIEVSEELFAALNEHQAARGESPEQMLRRALRQRSSLRIERPRSESVLDRFLNILSRIAEQNPDSFPSLESIRGTRRLYFSRIPEEITNSGKANKPVRIPNTEWWVTSNTSTETKARLLTDVFRVLRLDQQECDRWMSELIGDHIAASFAVSSDADDDPFRI